MVFLFLICTREIAQDKFSLIFYIRFFQNTGNTVFYRALGDGKFAGNVFYRRHGLYFCKYFLLFCRQGKFVYKFLKLILWIYADWRSLCPVFLIISKFFLYFSSSVFRISTFFWNFRRCSFSFLYRFCILLSLDDD